MGKQIHSRDYDGPYSNNGLFIGKQVLIVGGRSSGTDLHEKYRKLLLRALAIDARQESARAWKVKVKLRAE